MITVTALTLFVSTVKSWWTQISLSRCAGEGCVYSLHDLIGFLGYGISASSVVSRFT
jgi:hypothetical protein